MAKKICFRDEALGITLTQSGVDRFIVQYCKQITGEISYRAAAMELGSCIMHALACVGKLDNRVIGE